MNIVSSFSHAHVNQEIAEEEEFDVDEEGKGLIGARQGGRLANYMQICVELRYVDLNYDICVCLLNYVINLNYARSFYR
jgi:hypothetical protein